MMIAKPSELQKMNYLQKHGLLAVVGSFLLLSLNPAVGAEKEALDTDHKIIIGYWQCTQASFNDKPLPELVGSVHLYKENGEVETQTSDYWARWQYRLDVKMQPKVLAVSWADGKQSSEIYELTKNQLRIRMAEEPQSLAFDQVPKGKWNELKFKRITDSEAQTQITKLKAASDDEPE
jgi:hypothetical protein